MNDLSLSSLAPGKSFVVAEDHIGHELLQTIGGLIGGHLSALQDLRDEPVSETTYKQIAHHLERLDHLRIIQDGVFTLLKRRGTHQRVNPADRIARLSSQYHWANLPVLKSNLDTPDIFVSPPVFDWLLVGHCAGFANRLTTISIRVVRSRSDVVIVLPKTRDANEGVMEDVLLQVAGLAQTCLGAEEEQDQIADETIIRFSDQPVRPEPVNQIGL